MNLEQARQESDEASARLADVQARLDEVTERLHNLRVDLHSEKAALKALEAEAVSARAAGKTVKTAALDSARGAVRITQEAIEVVSSEVKKATEEREARESVSNAARRGVQSREAGALLFSIAPVVNEIVDRLRAADPRGEFGVLVKFTRIVGGYSPSGTTSIQHQLASAGLDVQHGTGSDARRAANGAIESQVLNAELARLLPRAGEDEAAGAPVLRRVV